MFINDQAVVELFMKSHKPIEKAMKIWLVYKVILSINRKIITKVMGLKSVRV